MPLINAHGRGDSQINIPLVLETQWGEREHPDPNQPPGYYLHEFYQKSLVPINPTSSIVFDYSSVSSHSSVQLL